MELSGAGRGGGRGGGAGLGLWVGRVRVGCCHAYAELANQEKDCKGLMFGDLKRWVVGNMWRVVGGRYEVVIGR